MKHAAAMFSCLRIKGKCTTTVVATSKIRRGAWVCPCALKPSSPIANLYRDSAGFPKTLPGIYDVIAMLAKTAVLLRASGEHGAYEVES